MQPDHRISGAFQVADDPVSIDHDRGGALDDQNGLGKVEKMIELAVSVGQGAKRILSLGETFGKGPLSLAERGSGRDFDGDGSTAQLAAGRRRHQSSETARTALFFFSLPTSFSTVWPCTWRKQTPSSAR